MLLIETLVLLAAFTIEIWLATLHGPLGGIHWYPKTVQERALELGLVTRKQIAKRAKAAKSWGMLLIAAIVLGSVLGINRATGWSMAFGQIYLMLFVMNWHDAIVVDYLWVAKTSYWRIPELGEMPIAKPWSFILKERIVMTLIYLPISALFACLVLLVS